MKQGRRQLRALIAGAVAALVLAAGGAVAESPPPTESSEEVLVAKFKPRLKPRALPQKEPAPVTFHLSGRLFTRDGSRTPALEKLTLFGDRHVALDVTGVPVCRARAVPDIPPPWKKCKDAIVGTGKADVEFAYPEHMPITISSELSIYNGGLKNGKTRLWIHGYVFIPTKQAILVPVVVKNIDKGAFGLEAVATVPVMGEGFAHLRSFSLTIHKRVLSAVCPRSLRTRLSASFSDQSVRDEIFLQTC